MIGVDLDALLAGDRSQHREALEALRPYVSADQGELLEWVARHAALGNRPALDLLLSAIDEYGLDGAAIRGVLIRSGDHDDVHQDVLIAVAASIQGFAGAAKFTTWLHSVARNTAVGHLRRQSARGHLATDGSRPVQTPTDPADLDAFGPAERMSSIIANRASVRDAIDALPDPYSDAVRRRDLDGISYAELAELLGIGLSAAKSRVARGRAMLAVSLRSELDLA